MNRISTYILTFNEEDKIANAILSVKWSDEILVIDSHSTDNTAKIAQSLGAKVIQVDFTGFGDLRNRALEICQHDWVFSLDSDEVCTTEAAIEIKSIINNDTFDVLFVPRRNFFLGNEVKHSGWYPNYRQPQLFRKSFLRYDDSPVHEGYILKVDSRIGYLRNAIWQYPFKNLSESILKMNRYSNLGAKKKRQANSTFGKALTHATWAFIKHYVLKLGFLDGWQGFFIAFSYFEVTLYRYAKAVEMKSEDEWRSKWRSIVSKNVSS
jgi:glycosyltransferase involved in cell wall biosynthesis